MKNVNPENTQTQPLPDMVVEESKTVPDGEHNGIIRHVEFSERGEEGFPYVDLHIEDTESGVIIKAGYAASRVTPATELGKLIARFGGAVIPGMPVPWTVLDGPCIFATETERKKHGKFARVLLDSVRPKKA